jgi:formylglycine-generating enzyme required for sulfatase activity
MTWRAHALVAPAGQRLVPAGSFLRGCTGEGCGFDEAPARTLTLSAFFIDEREVAQREYAACVSAAVCQAPADHYEAGSAHPVRNLRWREARAYCSFRGGRLPSEAEWEKAMRGTDGRVYPWGAAAPTCEAAVGQGCGGPLDVGGRPAGASPYGVVDGAGNVREWTADWYAASYYGEAPDTDPPGPAEGASRVVRGGSFASTPAQLRVTARIAADPAQNHDDVGFRCVYDLAGR